MRVQHAMLPLVAVLLVTVTAGPGAAEDAPLLPLNVFFANPDASWDYRVSPDGTRLAWIAMNRGRATCISGASTRPPHALSRRRARRAPPGPARTPTDGAATKASSFLMDGNGDENAHLFAVDTDAADPDRPGFDTARWRARPARSHAQRRSQRGHRQPHGAHRADVRPLPAEPHDRAAHVVRRKSGRRLRVVDVAGQSPAHALPLPAGRRWVAEVPDGVGGWREAIRGAYGDHVRILGYPRNPRYAWALSNRGRNRVALVRIDLRNGHEELLYEHPIADLYGGRVLESGAVSYVWAWPGFQDWRFYDAFLQADLTPSLARERSALRILSEDRQRRWLTFAVEFDRGDEAVYLLDRSTGEKKVLAQSPLGAHRAELAPMEPVTFPARDGLTLHGLLTVPLGTTGPRPMVLLVHGGPWAQDHWGYDPTVQFLANRGYALLQVNYRGSTGYGRDLLLAGMREFAARCTMISSMACGGRSRAGSQTPSVSRSWARATAVTRRFPAPLSPPTCSLPPSIGSGSRT